MNCKDIEQHIDNYLDGQLDQHMNSVFQQHLVECTSCARKVRQMKTLLTDLQALPVVQPSADFEKRVFAEVRRHHQVQGRGRFVAGFATAMAASVAIWAATTMLAPQSVMQPADIISVAVNETRTVRLMFDAQSDLDQVSLTIQLPDNMQLAGYPGQHQLNWQTSLKKGANVLALPVMAIDSGEGELVAELSYGDRKKTFRVVLKAGADGVMRYQLEDMQSA